MGKNRSATLLTLAVLSCFFRIPAEALAQKISFGVVTGTTLMDDFPSGSIARPCVGNGCGSVSIFQSNDASERFIIGASAEVAASKRRAFHSKSKLYIGPFSGSAGSITCHPSI